MTTNIAILGFGEDCSQDLVRISYETGALIAQRDWTLITGGTGGVFQSARQGALDHQGVALAMTETEHRSVITHATAVLPVSATSLKRTLLVESADAAILIGGWVGTLDLAVQLISQKKMVVAIQGTGGVANEYAGCCLIKPNGGYMEVAQTPEAAIHRIQTSMSQ